MSFFQQLVNFFRTLFAPSKPESVNQQKVKKIEMNLSRMEQPLCKNGEVQIVVAEALSILYKNTNVLHKILDFMGSPGNALLKSRTFDMLIQTGYIGKSKKMLESLSYEMRKKRFEQCESRQYEREAQGHSFIELQKELQLNTFMQIEQTLKDLELFYELCNFNFISAIKLFNPNFDPIDKKHTFSPVPNEKLTGTFLDLYYVTAKLEFTGSLVRAIVAILSLVPGKSQICSSDVVMQSVKKIATVLNKILTPEVLKNLIAVGNNDAGIEPKFAASKSTPLTDYIVREKTRFQSDEQRLTIEAQDQQMSLEIQNLFGDNSLLPLQGYDSQHNQALKNESTVAFLWITPMQIIKTFISCFFEQQVCGLLNDIVLEGFFNSPEKKTEFSTTIFACLDIEPMLKGFEDSFAQNQKNDVVLLLSHLRDSQKDTEFSRNLSNMVNTINHDAKNFIQTQVSHLYNLYKLILQLSEDSRKSTPETISNIKFLFTSSRNRSRVEFLEKSLPKWAAFLSLMKNYAVIGQIEVPREESRQQPQFEAKKM